MRRALRFISSMQMGLFLLSAIVLAGIAGSITPAVYHSPMFIGAGVLLFLNLLACSVVRGRTAFYHLLSDECSDTVKKIKNSKSRELTVPGVSLEAVASELKGMLAVNRYRVRERHEQNGVRLVSARRNAWGQIGSPVIHFSLALIIAGSLVSGVFTKSASFQTAVPGSVQMGSQGFPFDLQVKDFQIEYYPDGSPSQYKSQLVVISGGQAELEKTISVNNPLSHKGTKVYQHNYGWLVNGNLEYEGETESFQVEDGGMLKLPGPGELTLRVKFLPDYEIDEYGQPFSRTTKPDNPRVIYLVYSKGMPLGMGEAGFGQTFTISGVTLRFEEFKNYTGLLVKQDPGLPLVWTGFVLVLMGLGIHFCVKPRRVWALINPTAGGVVVHLVSENNTPRNIDPDMEMENFVTAIKNTRGCPA